MKNLKENNVQIDVNIDWEKVSNAVKKAAATSIGELKGQKIFGIMMFVGLLLTNIVKREMTLLRTTLKLLKKFSYENVKSAKVPFKGKKENSLTTYYNPQKMIIYKGELETFLESLNSVSNSTLYGMQSENKVDKC